MLPVGCTFLLVLEDMAKGLVVVKDRRDCPRAFAALQACWVPDRSILGGGEIVEWRGYHKREGKVGKKKRKAENAAICCCCDFPFKRQKMLSSSVASEEDWLLRSVVMN